MDNNTENTGNLFTNIEENIQEIISNSIRNYFSSMPPFTRSNMARNSLHNQDNTITNIIRESMHISNDIMRSYNNNISEYNTNMRDLIRILQNINNNNNSIRRQQMRTTEPIISIPRNPIPPSTIPRMNRRDYLQNRRSNVLDNPSFNIFENILNNNMQFLPYTFQDVVIRPTDREIENACELFEYVSSIELINNRCPITLNDFQEGDQVRRIRHCGHTFIADSIISWFQNNVICPICRYDIRNYNRENEENTGNDVSLNAFTTIYNPGQYTTSMTFSEPFDVSSLHSYNDSSNNNSSLNQSINNSLESILRAALLLDTNNNDNLNNLLNTDISNRQHSVLRVEIPLEYEEYYDASNNFLGNNTNHFS